MTVTANFTDEEIAGNTACTMRYTDTSTTTSGTIGCWQWSFPGGTIISDTESDEQGPHEVEYQSVGPHEVTLTAGEAGTNCCPVSCDNLRQITDQFIGSNVAINLEMSGAVG